MRERDGNSGWLPSGEESQLHPHMTLAFARAYEAAATRITAPVSVAALRRIAPIGRGTRLLDIGAGTGALSIPAAYAGASVTAVDIAPGMVTLLDERLSPFPDAHAKVMDGQALQFADMSFDAVASVFGISLFPDWRRGLAEQVRVLRPGGRAAVATWRMPPGGGLFVILAEALAAVFPDRPSPAPPPGFAALADPRALAAAFTDAGLIDVNAEEIDAVWEGPAGPAYLDELRHFHTFVAPYAQLDEAGRAQLDHAILQAVDRRAAGNRIAIEAKVTLATGTRANGPTN